MEHKELIEQNTELDESALWDEEEVEEKDFADRKIGIARFFELLGKDFGTFYTTSMMFMAGTLPGVLVMYFSIMAEVFPGAVLGGILAGIMGAPFLCGMLDTMLRSMRDEEGLWWSRYKKAWHQNWKQSLVPGILFGGFVGIWCWIILHLPDMENVPVMVWCCMLLGIMFAMILMLYTEAQIVLINLPTTGILKNAGLFIGGYFPKSLAAGIVSGVYWALCFLYMPYTVVVLMITGAWFPVLISLMFVYPVLNRALHIEEDIKRINDEKYTETL